MQKRTVIAVALKENPVIEYSGQSTLNKLIKIVVYVLRFVDNLKSKNKNKERKLETVTLQKNNARQS